MGIPGFFNRFINVAPSGVLKKIIGNIDLVCVDGNGIVHPLVREALKSKCDTEVKIVNYVAKQASTKMKEIGAPEIRFYLDGTAVKAKIAQQRKRRYHNKPGSKAKELGEENAWFDTNCISPGTPFMRKLNTKMAKESCWTFNGSENPGEGEQKIFRELDGIDPEKKVLIHGLDADMVMLSLMSNHEKIILMRENEDGISYLDVEKVKKEGFNQLCKTGQTTKDALKSYVFLCFLLGNDFLPSVPSVHIRHSGMEELMDIYSECKKSLVVNDQVSLEGIQELFENLAHKEDELMMKVLNKDIKRKCHDVLTEKLILQKTAWRNQYYHELFNTTSIDTSVINECSESFIKGLVWNFEYYKCGKTLPKEWYYSWSYGATAYDIHNLLSSLETLPDMASGSGEKYLDSNIQLLAIMPPWSKDFLPKKFHKLYTDDSIGVSYMFPSEYREFRFLKNYDWEYIPRLPLVDWELLQRMSQISK